jgi:hypothetical protein
MIGLDNLPAWQGLALRLQTLSQEMLELAKADDWESVMERETQRRQLIENLFRQPLPCGLSPTIEHCIREVLACDSKVLTLGRTALAGLSQQLQALAQGRKANLAYAEFEE